MHDLMAEEEALLALIGLGEHLIPHRYGRPCAEPLLLSF